MGKTKTRSSNKQCPPNPTPWLVFSHLFKSNKSKSKAVEKHTLCTTTLSPPNNKFYLKSIPQLQGKSVLGCSHGWLLLIDRHRTDPSDVSLWNPTSFKEISLPLLPKELETDIYAGILTCPPEEKGSFVLLITKNLAAFCRPRDDAWVVQALTIEGGSGEALHFDDLVVCNGVLYGRVYNCSITKSLVVIEFTSDGSDTTIGFRLFGELEMKRVHLPSYRVRTSVAECCGEVYMIQLSVDVCNYERVLRGVVWRLDLGLMAWVEVKSLKGHVFFNCNRYCVSCHGATPEFGSGGLYFVFPEDKAVYFYRVEDASVTTLLPCPNLNDAWIDPFWVPPSYPRIVAPEETEKHGIKKIGEENKPTNPKDDHQGHDSSVDVHHKESETKELILCKLPQNVISQIAGHLDLFDYLSFCASCKVVRAAAPPIQSRTTPNHNSQFPPLLINLNSYSSNDDDDDDDDDYPLRWSVIDPVRFDIQYPMSIPKSFSDATIFFSNKGWLLTYDGKNPLQFLNPFTRVSGSYPPYKSMGLVSSIAFSTTPTSPDCLTVGINTIFDIIITYIRSGDSTWRVCRFNQKEQEFSFKPSCNSPVYHNGAFYFLGTKGHLGVFELKGEDQENWRVFEKPVPSRSSSFYSRHMVECGRQLVVVVIGHLGKWVDVFRWNHERESWIKLKSVGDHTIFIGPYSCVSAKVKTMPDMRNKIYCSRFRGGGLVFYSMETGKWHSVGSEETFSDFYDTRELLQSWWIQPTWSD